MEGHTLGHLHKTQLGTRDEDAGRNANEVIAVECLVAHMLDEASPLGSLAPRYGDMDGVREGCEQIEGRIPNSK